MPTHDEFYAVLTEFGEDVVAIANMANMPIASVEACEAILDKLEGFFLVNRRKKYRPKPSKLVAEETEGGRTILDQLRWMKRKGTVEVHMTILMTAFTDAYNRDDNKYAWRGFNSYTDSLKKSGFICETTTNYFALLPLGEALAERIYNESLQATRGRVKLNLNDRRATR